MDLIISGHNHEILNPKQKSFGYNCRKKDSCPINNEGFTPKVIYYADTSSEANIDQKFYFGLTETTFKECHNNHKQDVKHIKYQYNISSVLLSNIWNLKNNNNKYNIQWEVVDKVYGKANSAMFFFFRKKILKGSNVCIVECNLSPRH